MTSAFKWLKKLSEPDKKENEQIFYQKHGLDAEIERASQDLTQKAQAQVGIKIQKNSNEREAATSLFHFYLQPLIDKQLQQWYQSGTLQNIDKVEYLEPGLDINQTNHIHIIEGVDLDNNSLVSVTIRLQPDKEDNETFYTKLIQITFKPAYFAAEKHAISNK